MSYVHSIDNESEYTHHKPVTVLANTKMLTLSLSTHIHI